MQVGSLLSKDFPALNFLLEINHVQDKFVAGCTSGYTVTNNYCQALGRNPQNNLPALQLIVSAGTTHRRYWQEDPLQYPAEIGFAVGAYAALTDVFGRHALENDDVYNTLQLSLDACRKVDGVDTQFFASHLPHIACKSATPCVRHRVFSLAARTRQPLTPRYLFGRLQL